MMRRVVIVGGGIVGAAIADGLAREQVDVTVTPEVAIDAVRGD